MKKSEQKFTVAARLQNLRLHKQMTWAQVAELLDLSPSMIHQVRAGKNRLSDKALFRLQEAEIGAGLRTEAPAGKDSAAGTESASEAAGERLEALFDISVGNVIHQMDTAKLREAARWFMQHEGKREPWSQICSEVFYTIMAEVRRRTLTKEL